jgi:hypothetical protein
LVRNDKTDDGAAREQRLATALRQNLRKRKLQQERRRQSTDEKPAAPAPGSRGGDTGQGR